MKKALLGLVLVVAVMTATDANAAFTRQPWIQDATTSSVTIYWEAGAGGGTQRLSYGVSTPDTNVDGTLVSSTLYKATVTGLPASSRFQYKVTSGADVSPVGSFVTAPAVAEPFRFGVSGDNRSDEAGHASVVAATLPFAPDFMLNTGDIVDGGDYTNFFEVEAELLRSSVIFPAPGNHDATAEYAFGFDRPRYYAVRWGNALVLSIDSDGTNYDAGSAQHTWIEQQLQAANQDPTIQWKIAYHHHPVYSSGSHGDTDSVISELNPLYTQYDVDVVFNGHDHNYERIERDGVVYVVTGGGGVDPRSMGSPVQGAVISESVRHVTIVDVDGGVLKIRAIRPDGSLLDEREIAKGPPTGEPGPDPDPTQTPGPGPGPTNPGDTTEVVNGGCACSTTAATPNLAGLLLALGSIAGSIAMVRRRK